MTMTQHILNQGGINAAGSIREEITFDEGYEAVEPNGMVNTSNCRLIYSRIAGFYSRLRFYENPTIMLFLQKLATGTRMDLCLSHKQSKNINEQWCRNHGGAGG